MTNKRSKGLVLFLCLISLLLLTYWLLPTILTSLFSHLTGNEVFVEELILSQGYIKGLQVRDSDFTFRTKEARVAKPFSGLLRRDLDEIALVEPSIYLTTLSGANTELSFIKNLPKIRSLRIERGLLRLTDKGSNYELVISDLRVNIRDYSPKGGGKMGFNFRYKLYDRVGGQDIITGAVSGDSIIKPYFGDLALGGDIDLSVESISSTTISTGQLKAKGPFAYEKKTLSINELSLDVSDIMAKTDKGNISLGPLSAKTKVFLDTKTNEVQLTKLTGFLKTIGNFKGDIDIKLAEDYSYRSNLTIPRIDIKTFVELMKPLLSDNLRQWSLSGKASVEATFKGNFREGRPYLEGVASVNLTEGSFLSQDALKAGQGIAADLVVNLKYPQSVKKKTVQVSSNTRLIEGEFLWDRFYVNLKDKPLAFETGLFLPVDSTEVLELAIKTDLMTTGDYRVFILDPFGQWQFKANLYGVDIKALQGSAFKDSLSSLYPLLKDSDMSGSVDLEIDSHMKHKRLMMQGYMDIKWLSFLSLSKDIELKGLNARLPIFISQATNAAFSDNGVGFVSIDKLRIKNIELSNISMPLRSEGNRLTLSESLKLGFLDGSLELDSLEAGIDFDNDLWLKGSIRLSETNIAPITEALGFGSFSGRLNSYIHNIKLKGKSISTEGQIDIELFGGRVVVSNIYGQVPFNYIGADIEFNDIDLERLTETIKIGRITGIVKGSVKDLEIQYGQAASFVMDIETVPVEGVRQVVSTDAVENISILGTGAEGLSKVLSTGINQFFKEFPYKRLGLRCTLENDVFTIRGKIIEGGKEYIIKRGLLRGIDVINHNPENTISFREMQTRLNAIFQKNENRKERPEMQGGQR